MPFANHPSPFALLDRFPLDVAILRKEHDIDSDAAAARALGVDAVAAVNQTHGAGVAIVRDAIARTIDADALVTEIPGLTLTVRWGDCQNFVVYAPATARHPAIAGLIHAGWKGCVAGVIPAFFDTLRREWGVDPAEVRVGAGPSLCLACCDFTDPATELPASWAPHVRERCVNLRAVADDQFLAAGVPLSHLERHADCTRCMPDRYWTWRGGHKEQMQAKLRNVLACRIRA
jgi:copper oxidase (laccase) domain-containing protein